MITCLGEELFIPFTVHICRENLSISVLRFWDVGFDGESS